MNKSIRPKDVKDGMSTTIASGERASFVVQNAWAGALSDGRGDVEVFALALAHGLGLSQSSPATYSGPHPGLIQFLMADGSARTIKVSVNPAVFQALCTRSGRELIDQQSY